MTYKQYSNKKSNGKQYSIELYHTSGDGYILSVNEGISKNEGHFESWTTILFEDFSYQRTFLKGRYSAKKLESFKHIVDNVLTDINKLIDSGQDITNNMLKLIMLDHS